MVTDTSKRSKSERQVTLAMIAKHASKTTAGVAQALRRAGIEPQKIPGKRGLRVTAREACDFVLAQWPEAGPLHLPQ